MTTSVTITVPTTANWVAEVHCVDPETKVQLPYNPPHDVLPGQTHTVHVHDAMAVIIKERKK